MKTSQVNSLGQWRKERLKTAGKTYEDLRAAAARYRKPRKKPSWRMVKFWMDAQKTSRPIEQGFNDLVDRERAS